MTDLAAAVQAARDDLQEVTAALARMWEHHWDPDLPPPEVHTSRRQRSGSPALWTGPTLVQRAYSDVMDELARAHWHLARHSDVPVHWTVLPTDEWISRQREQGGEPLPAWRKATIPHSQAIHWCQVLDGMLRWLADHGDPHAAITEAAGHIASARGRINDLMPKQTPRPIRPTCLHCGDREAERGRKWCARCRKRHQRERGRCGACGLEWAS